MSHQEVDRLAVIQQVDNRQLSQKEAARQLNLSVRQVKRLAKRFRDDGAAGLISKHRGKTANNRLPTKVKQKAIELIRKTYLDFSPTFAHEKLTELHGLSFSVETLRKWMIEDEIWQSKSARKARIHPSRPRRSCKGELIQIDGSPHRWFEERGESCTLIVFIDDATSQLMVLHFAPAETTQSYMKILSAYLDQHGRPRKLLHNATEVKQILSIHHQRKLSKNLSCQLNNIEYQIITKTKGYRLRQSYVTLCEGFNGKITLLQKGKVLAYRTLRKGEAPIPVVDEKTLHHTIEQATQKQKQQPAYKPAVDHPWKRAFKTTEEPPIQRER